MNIHTAGTRKESNIIEILCSYVEATRLEDIPQSVRSRICDHVMDVLGVGIAASGEPAGKVVARMFGGTGSGARIIGGDRQAEPWDAAWANGTLCHLLDFDDAGFTHPSACTVPAVLAIGEARNASGADLITAMAVAYDVFARLITAFRPYDGILKKRGVHTMCVCGPLAAAVGAGKLLNLTGERLAVAVGLAASSGFGVLEHFGTWGKPAHAGNAARAGAFSALLASQGYQASPSAVTGHYGLFNALLGKENYDLGKVAAAWGERWAIETPGIGLKAFPVCNCAQRAARAVVDLRREKLANPAGEIERIEVSATEGLLENLHVDWPREGFEGKFSLRYVIAAGLLDGDITIDTFADDRLFRDDVQDLMQRITVTVLEGGYEDNEFRKATPIEIVCKDGTTFALNERKPKGCLDNPMTRDDVVEKFTRCASRVLDDGAVREAVALLQDLQATSVRSLMTAITLDRPA